MLCLHQLVLLMGLEDLEKMNLLKKKKRSVLVRPTKNIIIPYTSVRTWRKFLPEKLYIRRQSLHKFCGLRIEDLWIKDWQNFSTIFFLTYRNFQTIIEIFLILLVFYLLSWYYIQFFTVRSVYSSSRGPRDLARRRTIGQFS